MKGEFGDIVLLTQTGDRDVKYFEEMSYFFHLRSLSNHDNNSNGEYQIMIGFMSTAWRTQGDNTPFSF